MAVRTRNIIIAEVTENYLRNKLNPQTTPQDIEAELMDDIEQAFELENATRGKGRKLKVPDALTFSQIADILSTLYPICRISCAGENADTDYDLLAIYQTDGVDEGIYVTSEDTFRRLARQYNYNLTKKEFEEVVVALRDKVPRKVRCTNPDLVPVNNGIFNYRTKTLLPFNPDFVFLAKSHVDYNPNAKNVVIHNNYDGTDWDIETWMSELTDDPEITNVLWEILGAIVRPNVRWNKSAWFYSETGNNGKGTLCELMRELCGSGAYASIPISDFGKDFVLEPLTRATAVIVDENDVGTYIDKAANLKACITNDVIQINRKFKTPIAYQFFGFMVQCLNEFPRIRDKSDSFYRRQLFVPFDKCFTGTERKYIKEDYLHRKEVLEYVLWRVMNMDYYSLSEPLACKNILQEYKEFNDPVRQFFDEMEPFFVWDLLPFTFLYELYKAWFAKNSPSGSPQGKTTFINDLLGAVNGSDKWYCSDKNKAVRTSSRMDKPEPLIAQYNLKDWMNPGYHGNDTNKLCRVQPSASYRGLQRYQSSSTQNTTMTVAGTDETNKGE